MQSLNLGEFTQLAVLPLTINLGLGVVMAILIRWHFNRFSLTLSNRREFSNVLQFILLTTLLIISIVKTSLALSLGLVGALSIVRFRTPIKEPEELAYLFLSIAIGLGLGADQRKATVFAGIVILAIMAFSRWANYDKNNKNLYLTLEWDVPENQKQALSQFNEVIGKFTRKSDLKRFDLKGNIIETTYVVDIENSEKLTQLIEVLKNSFNGIEVTFIDQNRLPVA